MPNTPIVLKVGSKAFLDSFAGLVPCKVISIVNRPPNNSTAIVEITASRGAYKLGKLEEVSISRAVPREAVFQRKGCMPRIRPYTVDYPKPE